MRSHELGGWIVVAIGLCALAIPWFLWGTATVVAGLPLWLWWHVGWMALASAVFWLFARRAWGVGVEPGYGADADGDSSDGARGRPTARGGGELP